MINVIFMTKINRICIGGYRNIDYSDISLQQLTALLAPNNYGKSNILNAIMFASTFLHATSDVKGQMMKDSSCIPINSKIAGTPFYFEIEGRLESERSFLYRFSFDWYQQIGKDKTGKDGQIIGEYLGIKDETKGKQKYRAIISRTLEGAKYDATGRCNKEIAISSDELVLVKLTNNDNWNYLSIAKEIMEIHVASVDTIADPKGHFVPQKMLTIDGVQLVYDGFTQYLYQLKQEDEGEFDYLISLLTVLVPTIESVQPVKLSSIEKNVGKDVPYELPDLYDVYVKEKYNNQPTPFRFLSTGSMRIFFLVTSIVNARKTGTQILLVEELENSIHPDLMQSLLEAMPLFMGDTKLLFTSHSPLLTKHLGYQHLYVGLPSDDGVVDFRIIKRSKLRSILEIAGAGEMALGEYLFELMLDTEDDRSLIDVFFEDKHVKKGGPND